MTEIYTPKEWLAIFGGSPVLRIDDKGYIYTFEESTRVFGGNPCGRIDWNKGYIYGSDYANYTASPIGRVQTRSNGVQEIYGQDYANYSARPILFVENDKIYTPEEYYRIFGGNPSGYVKSSPKATEKSSASPTYSSQYQQQYDSQSSSQPQKMPGLIKFILGCIAFMLICVFVGNMSPLVFAPILLGVAAGLISIYFIHKKRTGGSSKKTYSAPAKPQPTYQSTPAKSAPAASTSYAKSYANTCVKCGSTFYSSVPNPGYNMCIKCRKAAEAAAQPKPAPAVAQNKPTDFALSCSQCGVTYYSAEATPAVKLCPVCKAVNEKKQEPKPQPKPAPKPAPQPKPQPKPAVQAQTAEKPADFAHACSRCGATYYSAEAHPAKKLCPNCATAADKIGKFFGTAPTAAEVKQHLSPVASPKPAPKVDGTANFVQETNGKSIFACPFCGAKLAVPTGKGQLVIKCAKCAKTLSAKS